MGTANENEDLIRADWYARTVGIMSEQTIAANRAALMAQQRPGFTWDSGRAPTEAEYADMVECVKILDAETATRRDDEPSGHYTPRWPYSDA